MRLFSKRLYHGTPHAFDKFDTEHIGIGEGAQVHGWGLYFAEDKDVAEQYKTLGDKIKISIDGKEIIADNEFNVTSILQKLSVPKIINEIIFNLGIDDWHIEILKYYTIIKNKIEENEENANEEISIWWLDDSITRLEAIQKLKEILDWVKEHNLSFSLIDNSKLITVEIPDDLIFAEEDEPIDEQPKQVVEALYQIRGNTFTSVEVYKIPINPSIYEDIKNIIKKYIPSYEYTGYEYAVVKMIRVFNTWYDFNNFDTPPDVDFISRNLKNIRYYYSDVPDDVNWKDLANDILNFANQYTYTKKFYRWDSFKEFYDEYSGEVSPKKASLELEKLGVNGIHYDGREDGSCYVIFNPEYLKIVEVE